MKRLVAEVADEKHPIFSEMMALTRLQDEKDCTCPAAFVWRERARWIKYEETVEEEGTRFSKPHISLLTSQSLIQLKSCFFKGAVLLDLGANSYKEAIG